MVLYVGQVEVKEAVTYKAKVMRRHGETLQFAFSDKDNMSEIEREGHCGENSTTNFMWDCTHTTTLKYCSVNFFRKELCRQKNSVLLWTLSSFKFIYF